MNIDKKNIVLMASNVKFSRSRDLKAAAPGGSGSVRSKDSVAATRMSWRPVVGPAKDIPILLSETSEIVSSKEKAVMAENDEKQRRDWRPVVGPLAI